METTGIGILTSRKTQRIIERGLENALRKALPELEQMAKKKLNELPKIKAVIKANDDGDFLTVMKKS